MITGDLADQFRNDVNDMLREGWKVVPGTLAVSGAAGHNTSGYSSNNVEWAFVVVLEKVE